MAECSPDAHQSLEARAQVRRLTGVRPTALVLLGSPSDDHLLMGVQYPPSVNFLMAHGSVHRTYQWVVEDALDHDWDAVIAVAGYTNALASAAIGHYFDTSALVFGVPVVTADNYAATVASVLSTYMLPRGVPLASTAANLQDVVNIVGHFYHVVPMSVAVMAGEGDTSGQTREAMDILSRHKVAFGRFGFERARDIPAECLILCPDMDNSQLCEMSDALGPERPFLFSYHSTYHTNSPERLGGYVQNLLERPPQSLAFHSVANAALFAARVIAQVSPVAGDSLALSAAEQQARYDKSITKLNGR